MNSRWKKVWADFWGNKSRAVLTILTITIGVFAVGFNSNASLYMIESMDSDFLSVNPSEAIIYASPMDENSVEIAREVAGVEAVEGKSTASASIIRAGKDDIAIEFTGPESAPFNLQQCFERSLPVVCGSTGCSPRSCPRLRGSGRSSASPCSALSRRSTRPRMAAQAG